MDYPTMNLNRDETVAYFRSLPRERQVRALALIGHELTIILRVCFENGRATWPGGCEGPFAVNEHLHQITQALAYSTVDGAAWDASDRLFGMIPRDEEIRKWCDAAVGCALAEEAECQRQLDDSDASH